MPESLVVVRWLDLRGTLGFDPTLAQEHLTDVERGRLVSIEHREERLSFLAGRTLLREVVAELTGIDPATVVISARCEQCGREHGRPIVAAPTIFDVRVSLSRCAAGVAAVATFGLPVGIDVEVVDAARFAGVEDVALSDRERRFFEALPASNRTRALAQWWTRKEAVLKVSGTGLRTDPRFVEVSAPGAAGKPSVLRGVEEAEDFRLRDLDFGEAIVGSLAVMTARV